LNGQLRIFQPTVDLKGDQEAVNAVKDVAHAAFFAIDAQLPDLGDGGTFVFEMISDRASRTILILLECFSSSMRQIDVKTRHSGLHAD
jgi:hypothetical protein